MKPFCWVIVMDLEEGPWIDDFFMSKEAAEEAAEIIRIGSDIKPRIIQLFSEDV